MKKKFLPLLLVGVTVISLPLILSPIVHAEEENPTSVTLCVKNSGTVFMIGEGFKVANCRNNDKLINIDLSHGIQGPKGDTGEKGDKGDPGEVGQQGEQGIQGEVGPQGLAGSNGADGRDGVDGVSEWQKVPGLMETSTSDDQTATATCPDGKKVVGGGYLVTSENTSYYAKSSYPSSETTWTSTVHRGGSGTASWGLTSFAICVSAL